MGIQDIAIGFYHHLILIIFYEALPQWISVPPNFVGETRRDYTLPQGLLNLSVDFTRLGSSNISYLSSLHNLGSKY